MSKTIESYLKLAGLTLLITILIWLPFLLKLHSFYNLDFSSGMNAIYRNFDGLEYVTVAKTFYAPDLLKPIPQSFSPLYYASHLPLYPFLIAILAPFLGYLKSMLVISVLFTIMAVCAFYKLVSDFKLSDHPLFMSLVFLILPARFVIVHSVGSPEPLFIYLTISALYYFMRFEETNKFKSLLISVFFGALAQLTRSPGILLFLALGLFVHWKMYKQGKEMGFLKAFKRHLRYWPFLFIPLALLGVFYLYYLRLGDFFAYFHSGDNIHLTFPPFQIFNKNQFWVGDIWLEDVIYIFLITFTGGMLLIKKKLYPLGFFVLTYMAAATLVIHRDISRYTLPVMPFVLIAYEKILTSKEFKIVLIILALGIYLYSQNFLIHNIAPIPNLEAFN